MLKWRSILLGILGLVLIPSPGHPQAHGEWTITPHVGFYHTPTDLGPVAPVGGVRYLDVREVSGTPSFGLTVDRRLHVEGLAVSVRGLVTLPADAPGTLNCYPGLACPAILLTSDAEVQVLSGVVGLRYHLPIQPGPVSPYATLGGGLKRTRFSWPEKSNWGVDGECRSESQGLIQFGIGLDLDLGGIPVRLEVSDSWTAGGEEFTLDIPEAGLSSARPPQRASQHDLNFSVGWSLSIG